MVLEYQTSFPLGSHHRFRSHHLRTTTGTMRQQIQTCLMIGKAVPRSKQGMNHLRRLGPKKRRTPKTQQHPARCVGKSGWPKRTSNALRKGQIREPSLTMRKAWSPTSQVHKKFPLENSPTAVLVVAKQSSEEELFDPRNTEIHFGWLDSRKIVGLNQFCKLSTIVDCISGGR